LHQNWHRIPERIVWLGLRVRFNWVASSMSAKTASKCILGSISWMIDS
jgi:hypothetical protein